jgi:hypothetical protein
MPIQRWRDGYFYPLRNRLQSIVIPDIGVSLPDGITGTTNIKSDESQVLDLQRYTLFDAGVDPELINKDLCQGAKMTCQDFGPV